MRRSAIFYLKLSGLVLFALLVGFFFPLVSSAQLPCGDGVSATGSADSTGALVGNACQGHGLDEMSIVPGLVLAPGQSIEDARKTFEKGARRGDTNAEVKLAVLYLYGLGTPQNLGTGLYWLKAAADQGNSRASIDLGLIYWKGWGVRADYAEALKCFRKAAELGDTDAMVDAGYMNDYGIGTAVDHAAAAEWYRRGAELGNALAENNLADLYLRGEGVPQSDELAFAWFQKAAVQGNTGARIKLGYLYANGRATRKDLETGYAWILAADMAGDHRGQEYLAALEEKLSPEQSSGAKRRAEELQSSSGAQPNSVVARRRAN